MKTFYHKDQGCNCTGAEILKAEELGLSRKYQGDHFKLVFVPFATMTQGLEAPKAPAVNVDPPVASVPPIPPAVNNIPAPAETPVVPVAPVVSVETPVAPVAPVAPVVPVVPEIKTIEMPVFSDNASELAYIDGLKREDIQAFILAKYEKKVGGNLVTVKHRASEIILGVG